VLIDNVQLDTKHSLSALNATQQVEYQSSFMNLPTPTSPLPPRSKAAARFLAAGLLVTMVGTTLPTFAQVDEPAAGVPYSPQPNRVLVTKVKHFDIMCWKIAAAGGTWYFEMGGNEGSGSTGFSSAFDQAGNDWIGNDKDKGFNKSPAFGGKHDYRGFPNFGNGDFDHPQRVGGPKASSRWVDAEGKDVEFKGKLEGDHLMLRSSNAKYETEYHFFPSHIAMKVLKADDKYSFLYEGPIGGEQDKELEKDYYVLKDGKPRQLNRTSPMGGLGYIDPDLGKKFPSPFFYFVDSDSKDTQVFYVGAKDLQPDSYGDEGWMQCNKDGANMVVFSFGRAKNQRVLTGTTAVCVFGFHQKGEHDAISKFIEARLAEPFSPAGKN
jgi:hypothetical protein